MSNKPRDRTLTLKEMLAFATDKKPKNAEDFTFSQMMTITKLSLCPDAIFVPTYPQKFNFDLIINSKNYGEVRLKIEEGLNLSVIEGDKTALDKLKEIGKKQAGKAFYYTIPSHKKNFISYPFKNATELIVALFQGVETENTKELEKLRQFVAKVENPIDTELLYKKTGIVIDDY